MKKAKQKIKRAGRGSVLLIAVLLLSSASIRVLSSASEVRAAGTMMQAQVLKKETEATEQSTAPRTLDRSEISPLLKALQNREARVEVLEKQLLQREKALAIAKTEIERRLVALEETEAQLQATLARAETAAEDDVTRLTSVYENMKPKDAAALFEEMEPNFAAGFLSRMRPEAAANVMAGLTPQTAYTISVIMAGRNAGAPKT